MDDTVIWLRSIIRFLPEPIFFLKHRPFTTIPILWRAYKKAMRPTLAKFYRYKYVSIWQFMIVWYESSIFVGDNDFIEDIRFLRVTVWTLFISLLYFSFYLYSHTNTCTRYSLYSKRSLTIPAQYCKHLENVQKCIFFFNVLLASSINY